MEMEQIVQNLGVEMIQQSQQGMTATQMMSSGLSFADIIMTMLGNQQDNLSGVDSAETLLSGALNSELQSDEQGVIQDEFADILKLMTPEIMKGIENSKLSSQEFIADDNVREFNKLTDNKEINDFTEFEKISEKSYDLSSIKNLGENLSYFESILKTNDLSENLSYFENILKTDDLNENLSYSDSIVKADPLQLAGLLDYIGTGIGIPFGSDISDNEMFSDDTLKNTRSNTVSSNSRIQFDPEEMLKSGEMEIVSYVPASTDKSYAQSSTESEEDDVLDFYRTMNNVKENVKTEETKTVGVSENSVNFNVEDMNKYAQNIDISFDRAAAETTMNELEYEPVDSQLLNGISENLGNGNSEFTVKLKPEGLGEILVKLVQNDEGGMLLTMVASSTKTAELLNRDLASLQSSLNQHNVEIVNNGVEVAENVMPMSSAFDQYDERRQDEGNQQNQFRNLKSQIKNISISNVSFDTENTLIENLISDQALNITI